jgi:IS5 family transposase
LKRINVDTTVQEKEIRFPTDSRLYDRARQRLVKRAKQLDLKLRQNYNRLSKKYLMWQSRYAHARQYKRARKCEKKLKTYLGRVVRDIDRKLHIYDLEMSYLLQLSKRLLKQERKSKNKIYSIHEPDVHCISKGKAHKRYEFGSKASFAVTSKGGWVVGALAFEGNPYDGHTLIPALEQLENFQIFPKDVYVDAGYKKHGYEGDAQVHVDRNKRGKIKKSVWKWMKRRAAVEPTIGHIKSEHRLNRCRLKGVLGDKINTILAGCGMNLFKIIKELRSFFVFCSVLIFFPQKFKERVQICT